MTLPTPFYNQNGAKDILRLLLLNSSAKVKYNLLYSRQSLSLLLTESFSSSLIRASLLETHSHWGNPQSYHIVRHTLPNGCQHGVYEEWVSNRVIYLCTYTFNAKDGPECPKGTDPGGISEQWYYRNGVLCVDNYLRNNEIVYSDF